jgi:hypothetical protein
MMLTLAQFRHMVRQQELEATPPVVSARDQAAAALRHAMTTSEIGLSEENAAVVIFVIRMMIDNLFLLEQAGYLDTEVMDRTRRWVISHCINYLLAFGVQLTAA